MVARMTQSLACSIPAIPPTRSVWHTISPMTPLIYAGHSTGFKAQSANLSIDGRTPYARSADPEEATSYEIGLKMQFDNGYLNMAYFHQSIEGFQSNVFTGTGFNLANAGEETHEGIEIDMMMALSENFVVNFSGIFIDAVYDDFKQGACDATGLAEAEFQCPSVGRWVAR